MPYLHFSSVLTCVSCNHGLQNRQLAVKSKAQVIAASSPAATAVSTTIVLKQCELSFGDTVKAVGESDLFGSWDSGKAPELQWQEGHDWQAELDVPAGDCSFKVESCWTLGALLCCLRISVFSTTVQKNLRADAAKMTSLCTQCYNKSIVNSA